MSSLPPSASWLSEILVLLSRVHLLFLLACLHSGRPSCLLVIGKRTNEVLFSDMPHATHPSADEDYANARLRLVGTRVVEPSETTIRDTTYEDSDGLIRKGPLRDVPEFCKVSLSHWCMMEMC